MCSRSHINPIDRGYCIIVSISWFYYYLTAKWKCSSWFESKRAWSYSNWFWVSISHIYVKLNFIKFEIFRLFCKYFPHILFLCSWKCWIFCLDLTGVISNFNIHNTFQHIFKFIQLVLFFIFFLFWELLDVKVMKIDSRLFPCYLCSAHRASFIN